MNNNLVKISIVNDESLLKACDILHDGYCDLSKIEYDENNGMWKAIFEREFFEDTKLMNFIYSFNECQVKNNIYRFFFNEDMELTFTFKEAPKGRLIDQELLNKKGSFYKWRNPFKKC